MTPELESANGVVTPAPGRDDRASRPAAHHFHLLVEKDEDGGHSAVVLNLPPGVGGCGDTPEEAVADAHDAIRGVLAVYADTGDEIPWRDTAGVAVPVGAVQRWIVVDG